jgi:hypothetical protein
MYCMVRIRKKQRSRLAAAVAAGVPALALVAGCAAASTVTPVAQVRPAAAAHSRSLASPAAQAATATQLATPAPAVSSAAAAPSASATAGTPEAQAAATGQRAGSPAAAGATSGGSRQVTFVNRVTQPIWVGASPDASHPMARTGWTLRAGHSVTITVPNHWNGRFWGRTGCVFRDGRGHCQTGDCDGKFQCPGYGAIPATLAEYNLDAWDNLDFYDVSMVDGSNLPMYIYPTSGRAPKKVSRNGCIRAGCTTAVKCPSVLKIYSSGKYVACESPCAKLGGDQYCCRGKWAPRAMCNPKKWPVDYARVFKKAEPYAYSYVDDDATSVYTCTGRCNYHIVFGVTPRR